MIRKVASRLHLWLGLAAGLFLILVGLTGSVLVFEDAIDAALNPNLLRVEPHGEAAPLASVARAVDKALPGQAIARIDLPREPEETTRVTLRASDREVFVDPYTATVIGSRLPTESLTGIIFELHTTLLAGHWGETAVGLLGVLLIVLSLTGLVLWWRGRKKIRRGLTVRWTGAPRRVNYDLHNVLGIYTVVPLLVVAFTGAGLIFYSTFSEAAHRLTGTAPPPAPPQSACCPDGPGPSIDEVLDKARDAFPRARPSRIDFPADAQAAYRVRLQLPEEIHPVGMTMVYVDQYSGTVLRTENATRVPAARRFTYWFYPLHIGAFGGFEVRLLYLLIGLAPVALAITGAIIWYLRRRKRLSQPSSPARFARPVTTLAEQPTSNH